MTKWELAKIEKRPFKPAIKSINKYAVKGDILGEDISEETVTAVKAKV